MFYRLAFDYHRRDKPNLDFQDDVFVMSQFTDLYAWMPEWYIEYNNLIESIESSKDSMKGMPYDIASSLNVLDDVLQVTMIYTQNKDKLDTQTRYASIRRVMKDEISFHHDVTHDLIEGICYDKDYEETLGWCTDHLYKAGDVMMKDFADGLNIYKEQCKWLNDARRRLRDYNRMLLH